MTGDFFLTQWFFLAMRWLCENVLSNNMFLTILISTVVLRLLTLPSDIKQRKTTIKTAKIQPEIAKLQERYKSDPRKLQLEQQKIMKENGVSMLGGCLPMLITLPLLFCFIAAFRFWGYEQNVKILVEMNTNIVTASQNADQDSDIAISETFLQSRFLWINNIWQADNGFSPVVMTAKTFFGKEVYSSTKKLIYFKDNPQEYNKLVQMGLFYDEIEGYNGMNDDQKKTAYDDAVKKYDELTAPLHAHYSGQTNGWFILPVLATLLQFLYAWYMMKKQNPAPVADNNSAAQSAAGMNKFMMYVMPIMSFIFCLQYTSAFAMYWTLSSLIMLVVNVILTNVFKQRGNELSKAS